MGEFERPLKGKKNGVFVFVISHLVLEIFKIVVLCKLGTDDVIRCDNMEVKIENISPSNDAKQLEFVCTLRNEPHDYFDVAMATVFVPVSFCCKSNAACLTV